MPQTRLSNYWCSNIYLQKEAATAQNQFMKGLAKYIDTDVKFLGTFTGVNPDGATLTTNLEMKVSSGPLASETVICTDPAGGDGEAAQQHFRKGPRVFPYRHRLCRRSDRLSDHLHPAQHHLGE